MIGIIGGTGSGKSNALLNLISKQSNKYFDIIIFNPVSVEEHLLKLLQQKIPELKLVSDINELPQLSDFVGDSEHEKLIVFDDVIDMSSKDFKKIREYFTGGRKLGFSVVIMAQNYVSIPTPSLEIVNTSLYLNLTIMSQLITFSKPQYI